MIDTRTALDFLLGMNSAYQTHLRPNMIQALTTVQSTLSQTDSTTQLVITGLLALLSLFIFYRATRAAIGFLYSLLMFIIQLGIFVMLLLLVAAHKDTLLSHFQAMTSS